MVTIKSVNGGLEFWLDGTKSFHDLRDAIADKLSANRAFYRGAKEVVIFGKEFTELQKRELKRMLEADFFIKKVAFAGDEEAPAPQKREAPPKERIAVHRMNVSRGEGEISEKTLFIRHTVRNGQRVECKEDIVIIGDVNAGAEVIAGGSIIVIGKLRGLVHAGAFGRKDVCIVATALLPQQVRIAGKIAIIPSKRKIDGAEMVTFNGDDIVVQPVG